MADDFDPLKNTINKSFQDSNSRLEQDKSKTNSLVHRPSYNSFWKRSLSDEPNSQISSSTGQESQAPLDKRFSFANKIAKSFRNSKNSVDEDIRKPSSPSSNVVNPFPQTSIAEIEPRKTQIIDQNTRRYFENQAASFEDQNQDQFEDEHYGTEQASAYGQQEYYNYQKPYKKKGLSNKIDRLVQRVPALGLFYKQTPSSSDKYGQTSNLSDINHLGRELTANDLALNERYSDKTRIQVINLHEKEEAQPGDVCIDHVTNKIYLCDIGRSTVEIYDINRILQHVIDGSTMIKFKPTAITIAFDGTVIVASHFSHCLHMYSPKDSQSETNCYSYKQFKLGVQGSQIHQFTEPAGISLDSNDGYLYVCDRGNYRIQVFRPEGICERVIELFLNSRKKYQLDPVRVALQKNSDQMVCIIGLGDAICFVPKHANGRIYVDLLYIFDENGLGLENAAGIAVDSEDRIFISDTNHHRIVVCAPDGSYITSFGTEGDGLGQLKRPCGLDITNDGTVVVTDPGNKRLQLFGFIDKERVIENDPPNDSNDLSDNTDRNIVFEL